VTAGHLGAERQAILADVLRRVPLEGWSEASLRAALGELGYQPSVGRRAFPGGIGDVLAHFVAEADRHMAEDLAARDLASLRVRERVAAAVRARLEAVAPYREAVRRALAFYARPARAATALGALYRTVDAMWRAVGDDATDFSFYSKRGLLAAVYGATLLYWLDDRTEGCVQTWRFLDRRIAEVMMMPRLRGRLERVAGAFTPRPVRTPRRGRPGGTGPRVREGA